MPNLIFGNIDWKQSRHDTQAAERRNLLTLERTVSSIVQNMHPAVLCFCEVGVASIPLSDHEMRLLAELVQRKWSADATKHRNPDLRFHYENESPYLTVWDANQCDCRHFTIMQDIFDHKEPRTAQHFLCCLPDTDDSDGVDVINVHAPSGKPILQDK